MTDDAWNAFREGFDEARDTFYRIEKELLAKPGAVRLSTLVVGDTFEWAGQAEWFGDGRKAERYTISEIVQQKPYADILTLQPGDKRYYCKSGGITDRIVLLIPKGSPDERD
jgi:hypothetical protein